VFRYLFVLLFFSGLPYNIYSQVFPKENSKLNYRLIGFNFPSVKHASKYTIEIASGNYDNEAMFKKNSIKIIAGKDNRIIGEVPSFGSTYTWQYHYFIHQKQVSSILYHFNTLSILEVDTNNIRLRILKQAEKYQDAYVFLDGNRILYDMKGNPVWFLPDIEGLINEKTLIRDLKSTPAQTITLLIVNPAFTKIFEINYNGAILWKGPDNGIVSGDSIEHYHHELTRLSNGNYMVLGTENVSYAPVPVGDSMSIFFEGRNRGSNRTNNFRTMPFGTLIEYNKKGDIVWSWKSSRYFKESDIYYHLKPFLRNDIDVHDNSFFFDEKKQAIYVSFRNISRVIKIKYPEGTVTDVYGERFRKGIPEKRNELFTGQHSIRSSDKGYLYLINNNTEIAGLPAIIIAKEPDSPGHNLSKIWEYDYTIDSVQTTFTEAFPFLSGGNVIELPDQSIFASMPGLSKVFIVNRKKKILWEALPEKWNPTLKKWEFISQYRANIIISRAAMEQLIWNSEFVNDGKTK